MKSIPRKRHGFLDYLVGILPIAVPWLFGLRMMDLLRTSRSLGAGALVYSIVTVMSAD